MQPHLSCSDSTTPGSSSLDPPPLLNLNLQQSLEGLSWPARNTPGAAGVELAVCRTGLSPSQRLASDDPISILFLLLK